VTKAMHNLVISINLSWQSQYLLKKEHSLFLNERWDIHPFEDQGKLENICNKRDCALFVFG
jgi:hypothetical protein